MNYKKLVPPNSFIGQYMEYMSYVETAESYDFWCAIWAIGDTCGRRIYVARPNTPVYLNWYLILAAESGSTRKSTAIASITRVVEDNGRPLLAGKTSPESLELLLHEQTRMYGKASISFAVSELVTILGREGYMSSMPGLLTDLYDCPSERRTPGTLKSGEIIQKDVFITFISASTPAWIVTAINPSVIEGGFTSRVIFVVDDSRKRAIPWPRPRDKNEDESIKRCLSDLRTTISSIEGIGISEGGLKKFSQWYTSKPSNRDSFLSSFEAREDDHVLRLAACLCINDGTLEIQTNHISTAIKIISKAKAGANSLFGGDFSQSARLADAVTRIREILIDFGTDGIKHGELLRKMQKRLDAKELATLIKVLHECGMIQIFEVGRGKFYRATRGIEKFGVTSEVLERLNLR
jgi:hypothetical protein